LPARVLLAEEETLVREGLRLLFEGHFRVVGTVADAESLSREARRLRSDVVVAGLRLLLACPDGALSKTPGVAFVVLASEGDDARAERLPVDVSGWVLGVTPASASANIRKLVDGGVLREATGRKRDQVFVAPEIVRFIAE
jgi:DNA-binding NarL/FixJ family response regulator